MVPSRNVVRENSVTIFWNMASPARRPSARKNSSPMQTSTAVRAIWNPR